jgi:hypothetical protein
MDFKSRGSFAAQDHFLMKKRQGGRGPSPHRFGEEPNKIGGRISLGGEF